MTSFSKTPPNPSATAMLPEPSEASTDHDAIAPSNQRDRQVHRRLRSASHDASGPAGRAPAGSASHSRIRARTISPAPLPWADAVENGFAQLERSRRACLDEYLSLSRSLSYQNLYGFDRPPTFEHTGAWIRRQDFTADGVGIVMARYKTKAHYNPLTIASQAVQCYENLFSRDAAMQTQSMKNLMRLVKYFEDTQVNCGSFVTWYYYFPFQDLWRAWNSCLSQSCIMDVLLKYFEITGEPRYRELAVRAIAGLHISVSSGGLATRDSDGHHWLQEYPGSQHFPDVLNGLMSTTLIVLANRHHLGDAIDPSQVAEWLTTIRHAIRRYTNSKRVDYARGGGHTPVHYYPQMIAQLGLLAQHDPNEIYHEYAARWDSIYRRASRRRRLIAPLSHARRRLRRWRYGL